VGHSHEDRPYVTRRDFLRRSAALGAVAVGAGPVFWQQPSYAADAPVEHLHLQYGADAARSATVSWSTPAAVSKPFVELDGSRLPAVTRAYPGYAGRVFHSVRLDGLSPSTGYNYAVGQAGAIVTGDRLTTGPSARERFTFTGFGDQGYSEPTSGRNDAHHNTLLAKEIDPALHVIVGDLAYANGEQTIWDDWMRMVSPMARRRPWMPCIGNHEIESQLDPEGLLLDTWGDYGYDPYRTRWDVPRNGLDGLEGCFYRFRYGSVEFISIDNNDVTSEIPINVGYTGGRQVDYVRAALAAAAADPAVDFIVVLMHQAAFSSSSKHGSDLGVQTTWFDLFAEHSVDLVLQGHDHTYERTHAMRGMTVVDGESPYSTDTGTVYCVVGNGGEVQEPFKPVQPEWSAFRQADVIGTLRVDVDPFATASTARLTLGQYAASDGRAIEKGIVLERPFRHARTAAPAAPGAGAGAGPGGVPPQSRAPQQLPATGGLPGLAATGAAVAAGAAALKVTVGRLREPDDLDLR
jgi:hypothetical protein